MQLSITSLADEDLGKKEISGPRLIVLVAVFLNLFANISFFTNVLNVYPLTSQNFAFLISIVALFTLVTIFLLSLVCFKYTIKPVLIGFLLLSSLSAYFMDTFGVIIDDVMIDNIVNTDLNETLDLLTVKQFLYVLLLGFLPSIYIYKIKISRVSIRSGVIAKAKTLILPLILIVTIIFIFSNYYASFFREHKPLRFYANPSYYIYSAGKYIASFVNGGTVALNRIGVDASVSATRQKRKLTFFVVGETARADHFSLNGYDKITNPKLSTENVVNFTNVWSCGTSTAVSVPCLFSILNRENYDKSRAKNTENVLDVLQRTGTNVLWLDNNSSSKGVADRVPYQSYRSPGINPVCDVECRDVGMLSNLQQYIDEQVSGDIFIVLHQMGNHGPAYFKRYPTAFEKFTPTCKTSQIERCSQVEISNSYDNAILYTDYFLSKSIALLKNNINGFDSALVYVSDHGESLGENNFYLHGMPYLFAPDAQKHVPLLMWFGEDKYHKRADELIAVQNNFFSHDNLFHTILGLMEVRTEVYDKEMDILAISRAGENIPIKNARK